MGEKHWENKLEERAQQQKAQIYFKPGVTLHSTNAAVTAKSLLAACQKQRTGITVGASVVATTSQTTTRRVILAILVRFLCPVPYLDAGVSKTIVFFRGGLQMLRNDFCTVLRRLQFLRWLPAAAGRWREAAGAPRLPLSVITRHK